MEKQYSFAKYPFESFFRYFYSPLNRDRILLVKMH